MEDKKINQAEKPIADTSDKQINQKKNSNHKTQVFAGAILGAITVILILLVVLVNGNDVGNDSNTNSETPETNSENEKEIEREFISIDSLIYSLENLARAEQNVGKFTHLFGTIESIGTDTFILKHFYNNNKYTIPMNIEKLAQLNKGEFIAVYAVVDEINQGEFKFKDCKQIGFEPMDEYVINKIKLFGTSVIKKHNDFIVEYVMSRGDTFKITNDNEISSIIVGKWYVPYYYNGRIYISSVEYFADGDITWQTWDEIFEKWRDTHNDWTVKDGILDGYSANKTAVYKISDNILVTSGELHIRAN